jgi:hypothetical protein
MGLLPIYVARSLLLAIAIALVGAVLPTCGIRLEARRQHLHSPAEMRVAP